MQEVAVNYWAILVCAVASMVLGSLWYGPLFGKLWMSWSGINPSREGLKATMTKQYILALVGSLVMAFVLSHALVFAKSYLGTTGVSAGLQTGFWNWLGFVAPVTLGTVLWEGKTWKLWVLNNAYQLILLLIMGAILALWQ